MAKTVETQKSLENLNKIILDIYLKCKALNFFFKKDIKRYFEKLNIIY